MGINTKLAENQQIETERLRLRKVELSDAEDMYEYCSDPETVRYVFFPQHQSLADTQAVIANYFLSNRLREWGLEERASGKFIGAVGLQVQGDAAEIGWTLNKAYWGQGLVPEAARALRDMAFTKLGLRVIFAEHIVANRKSGRVMAKIGMRRLGQRWVYIEKEKASVLCEYYALTAQEWAGLGEDHR